MYIYRDKNGRRIMEGDIIRHESGGSEKVYACGDNDLGVLASSKSYIRFYPFADMEYYPLSNFYLDEWEVA